jgi:hypothetical protein
VHLLDLLREKAEPWLPPSAADSTLLAEELRGLAEARVYHTSIAAVGGAVFFLARRAEERLLGILHTAQAAAAEEFEGQERAAHLNGQRLSFKLGPTSARNADALRRMLSYTAPRVVGLQKSFGFGDRLGLATPGHIRAVRGTGVWPVFAQQSIREMERTERTPQQVMDDATWGVFQEGWHAGWGADADHLKAPDDIDRCVAAGFTWFTIDPGDHVDDGADTDSAAVLAGTFDALPWEVLDSSPQRWRDLYVDAAFDVGEGVALSLSEEELLRAATKYGRAVAHTAQMYRHLANRMGDRPFELEVSVDETETPTSIKEHFFVARELKRLGVEWTCLAPRYVGRFEKAVDYIGDLATFERQLIQHVAVARALGPYKLSMHSGSDKFGAYPPFARRAGDLVHVKTAGTSYLEALRAIAGIDPDLFREILGFAHQRYDSDKATYHVSADPSKAPTPEQLVNPELAGVLDGFDARQLLHVTYGSVLTAQDESGGHRFHHRLLDTLRSHEEDYHRVLEEHFARHLAPFT